MPPSSSPHTARDVPPSPIALARASDPGVCRLCMPSYRFRRREQARVDEAQLGYRRGMKEEIEGEVEGVNLCRRKG